jgi:hypothetical protein
LTGPARCDPGGAADRAITGRLTDDGEVPSLDVHREITARGPQSPDEVWDRYVRPARWPQWSPQIRGVDYAHEFLIPGASGRVRAPLGVPLPFRVLAVDDADPARRSWRWRAGALGVHLELEHVVEPAPGGPGGTVTRLVMTGPAPLVLPYVPLAWVALRRLVG